MTRDQRFLAWRITVIVAMFANIAVAWNGASVWVVVSMASLVTMLALLLTTPADAIVLPRRRSERIILGGFAIVAAIATGGKLLAIAAAFALFALGILALGACRHRSRSAWWAAIVLWQPLFLKAIHATA